MVNPPEDQGVSDQPGEEDFCLWAHLVQNDSRQYQPNDVFEMVGCSHLSDRHKEEIRQDFDEAVARIHEGKNETTSGQLQLGDVFRIIKRWVPTIDMLCLFVRWAKKTKYHFGTSSISTVRVLAKHQMGSKTASAFLDSCCTIRVTPRKKDAKGNCTSLAFLENAIAVGSIGAMGKIGMRSGKGQTKSTRVGEDPEDAKFAGVNLLEFHTPNSFDRKLMADVDHRFLAREFVRMLFGIVSPASDNEPVPAPISMCEKAMMGYSIRMNEECKGRFECVKSLAGIALKYPRTESIRNHRTELQSLYEEVDNKADKSNELFQLGLTFADNGLTAQELEKEILTTTFEYFLGLDRAFSYHNPKNKRDHDRKWQVLRAMAFKLWLKRGLNANLRQRIGDIISPDYWERIEEVLN
eukprot:scaffold2831_cov65-Cylindrotheca_fusiformis.AAC.2